MLGLWNSSMSPSTKLKSDLNELTHANRPAMKIEEESNDEFDIRSQSISPLSEQAFEISVFHCVVCHRIIVPICKKHKTILSPPIDGSLTTAECYDCVGVSKNVPQCICGAGGGLSKFSRWVVSYNSLKDLEAIHLVRNK